MYSTGDIIRAKAREATPYSSGRKAGEPYVVVGESHQYGGSGKYIIVMSVADIEAGIDRSYEFTDGYLEKVGRYADA